MSVMPVGAIPVSIPTTLNAVTPSATDTAAAGTGAAPASGGGFSNLLSNALNSFESTQSNADQMAQMAATGQLTNVHDLTIATTEAELATQLTTAVRDRAVAAFNSIMSMPV